MRWRVTGANRGTGQQVEITVEADTRDDAVKIAGITGMVISDVIPIVEQVAQHVPPSQPAARPTPPPPTTPIVPIMLVKPPHRWGTKCNIGLGLTIVGVPLLCIGGVGTIPLIIGIILMIQGD